MTKKDMIYKLQDMELNAWNDLVDSVNVFGNDAPISNRARTRWAAITDICVELGIDIFYGVERSRIKG